MGNGAALTIMDRTSYSNKKLVDFMYKTAKDKNIPVSTSKPQPAEMMPERYS